MDKINESTSERLALALEELGNPELEQMILNARRGYYDCFKTTIATPLTQLVEDIIAAGHPEFAERVINSEFDSSYQEGLEWFQSKEGKDVWLELTADTQKRIQDLNRRQNHDDNSIPHSGQESPK